VAGPATRLFKFLPAPQAEATRFGLVRRPACPDEGESITGIIAHKETPHAIVEDIEL
jgi:hypothetical protein